MTANPNLSRQQLDRVRATAAILLPGSSDSPAPTALLDFDDLVQRAAVAVGGIPALAAAIDVLPPDPTWESLAAFAESDPSSFEQVSLVAVGAYFMSPSVLASLGLPTGERRKARPDQVVDELSTGILDAVLERGSPVRTLQDVNGAARPE